jgi:hypothetical protein
MALVFVSASAFAFYNLEGLVLLMLAILIFKKMPDIKGVFLVGVILGLLIIFKQSYGVYAFFGFVCLLLINNFKPSLKKLIYLSLGIAVVMLPFLGYFWFNKALPQFIYYTGVFSQEVKGHRSPFILTSLLFIPAFLFAWSFFKKVPLKKALVFFGIFISIFFFIYIGISPARLGRLSTYIKDPLIYYYGFLLVFPLVVIANFYKQKGNVLLYAVLLLALFLAGASSGRDYTTVGMAFPLVILLFLELVNLVKQKKTVLLFTFIYLFLPFVFVIPLLFSLFCGLRYVPSTIAQFEGIYLSQQVAPELAQVVKYIQSRIDKNQTMLCFPYCPLINVLAQRNSGSYFSFFYQETMRAKDQSRVITDLKNSRTKLIVIQKPGDIEKEASYENQRLAILRKYILANYHPTFSTQNFTVYESNK